MIIHKGFKIRIYPTEEQEQQMLQHIGSCRFIWNYMLNLQEEKYRNKEDHLSAFDMNNLLKPLKNDGEHDWLYDVSMTSLQIICGDLDKAYKNFFAKRARYPKFKTKKKSKPNFPVRCQTLWFDDNGFVHIEKLVK